MHRFHTLAHFLVGGFGAVASVCTHAKVLYHLARRQRRSDVNVLSFIIERTHEHEPSLSSRAGS